MEVYLNLKNKCQDVLIQSLQHNLYENRKRKLIQRLVCENRLKNLDS